MRFGLYCGLAMPVLFFLAWGVVAGYMTPLPTPHDTPLKIRSFYTHDTTAIRLGLFVTVGVAVLQAPLFGTLTAITKRVEGGRDTPLSTAIVIIGASYVLEFIIPALLYATAAFRPHRDPNSILLISDISWIMFIGAYSSAPALQALVGLAVMQDHSEPPLLPRWYAYYNFWAALVMIPGGLLIFFHHGPLAWNGLLAFWVPATVFGTWFFVTFAVLMTAVRSMESA
jgi:hypothetical protein